MPDTDPEQAHAPHIPENPETFDDMVFPVTEPDPETLKDWALTVPDRLVLTDSVPKLTETDAEFNVPGV